VAAILDGENPRGGLRVSHEPGDRISAGGILVNAVLGAALADAAVTCGSVPIPCRSSMIGLPRRNQSQAGG
jgi:hypothetical protein